MSGFYEKRWRAYGLPLVFATSIFLSACSGVPKTTDQCTALPTPSEQIDCLNASLFGNELGNLGENMTLGAVAGAVVGAGAGAIAGGPKGAAIGAGAGAGVGAAAGAWYTYDQALADVKAKALRIGALATAYENDLQQSNQEINILQQQLSQARIHLERANNTIENANIKLAYMMRRINDLNKTIKILSNERDKYKNDGVAASIYQQRIGQISAIAAKEKNKSDELENDIANLRKLLERYRNSEKNIRSIR